MDAKAVISWNGGSLTIRRLMGHRHNPFLSICSFVVFVTVSTALPARAQTGTESHLGLHATFGVGGADDGVNKGGALTAGAAGLIGPVLISFNAADLVLSKGDSYPYYRDYFSNGQSRCRNRLNGQFARDEDCLAVDVAYAFSFDASIIVPKTPIYLGGGRRLDDHADPWFGALGAAWVSDSGSWTFTTKANIGEASYKSILATVTVRLVGH